MHEDRLIDGVIADVKRRVLEAGASRAARIMLELSPDSHMDELSVSMHLESHLAEDPALAGAEISFRHVPQRIFCPACHKEFERKPGVFVCPQCAKPGRPCGHRSGLRVLEVELI
ncbi:MAG: hydrogenase maturation nickel metallochaperone HypA [bacterium]